MEDQIISFETAKLAKEKGFDEYCSDSYLNSSKETYSHFSEGISSIRKHGYLKRKSFIRKNSDMINAVDERFSAPTQSLLQKWLREEHNLWVEISIWGDGIGTQCLIKKADPKDIENDNSRIVHMVKPVEVGIYVRLEFNYEKTLEKGLQEALKLIKN